MSAVKILTLNSSDSSRASLDTGTSNARITANFLACCVVEGGQGGVQGKGRVRQVDEEVSALHPVMFATLVLVWEAARIAASFPPHKPHKLFGPIESAGCTGAMCRTHI